tara:strand:+ start:618 stop:980 length:363 start_codon:yes stop_codon:yes gene_type:complete
MMRKHNDHRDFYALAALLDSGYIGFTGPIKLDEENNVNIYRQVRIFQAYSQGDGTQTYQDETILGSNNPDSYMYIGSKGIEYFHNRSESRKGWYLTFTLALIGAIISGVVVSKLTVACAG